MSISAGALIMIGLLRRRRRHLLVPVIAVGLATPGLAFSVQDALHVSAESAPHAMQNERVVFEGIVASVTPSPSSSQLLISDDRYEGLTVVDVKSGAATSLTTAPRAGFRALWVDERNVAHRVPQAPFGGEPLLLLDSTTGKFRGPHFEHKTKAVVQTDDDVILLGDRVDEAGHLAHPERLSPSDDRCFAPQLVGDVVVFQCLQSGVWIARGKERFSLGDGAQPAIAHDGKTLVYVVTSDEGHVIKEADVVVVDLRSKIPAALVFQTARVERAPGVSDLQADGSVVVGFVVDNKVTLATIK